MTEKEKNHITNAMTYPNLEVLGGLLDYIDNMVRDAEIEAFTQGRDFGKSSMYLAWDQNKFNPYVLIRK